MKNSFRNRCAACLPKAPSCAGRFGQICSSLAPWPPCEASIARDRLKHVMGFGVCVGDSDSSFCSVNGKAGNTNPVSVAFRPHVCMGPFLTLRAPSRREIYVRTRERTSTCRRMKKKKKKIRRESGRRGRARESASLPACLPSFATGPGSVFAPCPCVCVCVCETARVVSESVIEILTG